MGIFSYVTSTLGTILLAVSVSILVLGTTAADELVGSIPCADFACNHPGLSLALGLGLFIAGRLTFDTRSSILRTSPPR